MARTATRPARVRARKQAVQARSRATVRALLEGAAQVLERRGYAGTTTDGIAERAGVSIGSLYQYFPNKDSILLALTLCHGVEVREALGPLLVRLAREEPPLEVALREIVRVCVELNGRRPALHRVLFEETPFPQEFTKQLNETGREVAEVLGRYLASRPEVRVRDPLLAAHLFLECLVSLVHRFVIAPPAGFEAGDCEAELVRLLHRYLAG